jgi:hypothetical protein
MGIWRLILSSIPLIKTGDVGLDLFMTRLKSGLDPVLANPLVNGLLLRNISLSIGDNVVNHRLSRQMQGWMLVDQSAGVVLYRSAPLNDLTLTLNASAPVTVSLWVF